MYLTVVFFVLCTCVCVWGGGGGSVRIEPGLQACAIVITGIKFSIILGSSRYLGYVTD